MWYFIAALLIICLLLIFIPLLIYIVADVIFYVLRSRYQCRILKKCGYPHPLFSWFPLFRSYAVIDSIPDDIMDQNTKIWQVVIYSLSFGLSVLYCALSFFSGFARPDMRVMLKMMGYFFGIIGVIFKFVFCIITYTRFYAFIQGKDPSDKMFAGIGTFFVENIVMYFQCKKSKVLNAS